MTIDKSDKNCIYRLKYLLNSELLYFSHVIALKKTILAGGMVGVK